jgi:hypothetical protein
VHTQQIPDAEQIFLIEKMPLKRHNVLARSQIFQKFGSLVNMMLTKKIMEQQSKV